MTAATALLAFGFVNPALLGGLGLVAVPILIHLLSRRRHQHIDWAATRFLLEAEKKNRRRMRIEQWLLIVLRCLAMILLALALARPFIQPGLAAALLGSRGQTQRIIILDDSASLAYRGGVRQDFDTLRETARRLLAWLHDGAPGDPVTFYLTSAPAEPLAEKAPLTAAALEDLNVRLEELTPVNFPADPRRVFQTVADSGLNAGADVYILSDFQRSDWMGDDEGVGAVFEPLVGSSTNAVRVVLIALDAGPRGNVGLLDAVFERPHTIAGLPAVLRATIANYTDRTLNEGRLTVDAGGSPGPPVELASLAPGEVRTVSAEVAFVNEGYAELQVGLGAGDGFSLDDDRRVSAVVASALRVLLVNGAPNADPLKDEIYFLRSALTPAGPFRSGIEVEIVDPAELGVMRLDPFDCVMLCNVSVPGPVAVAALEKYVRGGGGAVFFLGDEIRDSEEYNRVFYADGAGLLPAPLGELVRRRESERSTGAVRLVDHPVTAMFPAEGEALTNRARFYAYYRCNAETAADSSAVEGDARPATVLARYDDEAHAPALLERSFGRGRVLLFTSSVDLDWSDWPRAADGSYVVTMLETAYYAARTGASESQFVAGDSLRVTLSPEEYETEAVFRAPRDSDEPAFDARTLDSAAALGDAFVLEGPAAKTLGVYTVELARRDGGAETRPLSVNLDPRESDLRVAEERELSASLGNLPHEYIRASQAFLSGAEKAQIELWPALIVMLVIVLMAEQTLAWRFGAPGHIEEQRLRRARVFSYLRRAWRRRSLFVSSGDPGDERP